MSQILFDRIKLRDTGEIDVVVLARASAGESGPSGARLRLRARGSDQDLFFPASTTADGVDQWVISATIPAGAADAFPAGTDLADVHVEVTTGREVVSQRLTWVGSGRMWLPYPTAGRKLSLTEVTA